MSMPPALHGAATDREAAQLLDDDDVEALVAKREADEKLEAEKAAKKQS